MKNVSKTSGRLGRLTHLLVPPPPCKPNQAKANVPTPTTPIMKYHSFENLTYYGVVGRDIPNDIENQQRVIADDKKLYNC